ncbi:hypothetical protein I7I50_10935 [Histoplasma capsulatum G186AR]|uniref:Uncharacterized protein n=1 Tax=Ajellomyces capsulatus TaxID=5037 RepID=A0A8H8D7U2_AJECA|nr:hypothetical protein I7I52_02173 [Histoplasma capsulatum]QSS69591.1 hypothetical protein I7I50_10935 [Histoplasma capsulatum G186AR]
MAEGEDWWASTSLKRAGPCRKLEASRFSMDLLVTISSATSTDISRPFNRSAFRELPKVCEFLFFCRLSKLRGTQMGCGTRLLSKWNCLTPAGTVLSRSRAQPKRSVEGRNNKGCSRRWKRRLKQGFRVVTSICVCVREEVGSCSSSLELGHADRPNNKLCWTARQDGLQGKGVPEIPMINYTGSWA